MYTVYKTVATGNCHEGKGSLTNNEIEKLLQNS